MQLLEFVQTSEGTDIKAGKTGEKPATTYILNALLVDSLASFASLLTDHDTPQQGVHHGDAEGVVEGHNFHLQGGFNVLQKLLQSLDSQGVGLNQLLQHLLCTQGSKKGQRTTAKKTQSVHQLKNSLTLSLLAYFSTWPCRRRRSGTSCWPADTRC